MVLGLGRSASACAGRPGKAVSWFSSQSLSKEAGEPGMPNNAPRGHNLLFSEAATTRTAITFRPACTRLAGTW